MKKFLFASANHNKLGDLLEIAEKYGVTLISADMFYRENPNLPPIPDVIENATTYLGNATLKAVAFSEWSNLPVVSDDSGIEVDYLNGEPGIYSARYGGKGLTAEERISYLLDKIKDDKERKASMRSLLVMITSPEEDPIIGEGVLKGTLTHKPRGKKGWGYEPIFMPEGEKRTTAEIRDSGETLHTHRMRAWEDLMKKYAQKIKN